MRTFAAMLVVAIALSTPACAGSTVHGLSCEAWMALLSTDDPLPMAGDEAVDLEGLMTLGPGALLFVGMAAEDRGDLPLAAALYAAAARLETGRFKARAAALAADLAEKQGDGEALLTLCRSEAGSALPPYRRARLELQALILRGEYAEAASAVDALRAAFPDETAADAVRVASLSFEASFLSGRGRWIDDLAALAGMEGDQAVYEALARAIERIAESGQAAAEEAIKALGPSAFTLYEARAFAGAKEYGQAVLAWRRLSADSESAASAAARIAGSSSGAPDGMDKLPDPLAPARLARLLRTLSRPAASDAARSFFSASKAEGAAAFAYLVDELGDWSSYPSRKYFELFWHGRFLLDAGKWKEAKAAFARAAAAAATGSERDAASWYVVECAKSSSPADSAAALAAALSASRNPAWFSDHVEALSREALGRRDGKTLAALGIGVAGRLAKADEARLAFICGRAVQEGMIQDDDLKAAAGKDAMSARDFAEDRLRAAYGNRSSSWYRSAAAYRLGEPLVDRLASDAVGPGEAGMTPEAAGPAPVADSAAQPQARTAGADGAATPGVESTPSPDDYALALARFGQAARIRAELGAEFQKLRPATVREAAASLAMAGRHSAAYRLIATQFWKEAFIPTRADAELYWPRPFAEAFAAAAASSGLDPHLLYGIARSESAFDPGAVSKSGAVGLVQLMPATADEMARRLKMGEWSLTDPEDSLTLGSAYFARVLVGIGGRILPAVCSYNAGPNRFKRWEAELRGLPADLLIEALPFAETRQYARNVAGAALSYSALYGEADLREYFAYLLGEGPKPGQ